MNQTHDGFEIEGMRCVWCAYEYYGFTGILGWRDIFSVSHEFNTFNGERKSYWSVMLFGFHLQHGWLWEREPGCAGLRSQGNSQEDA